MFLNILLFLRIPVKEIQQCIFDFVTSKYFAVDSKSVINDRGLNMVSQLKIIIDELSPFDKNLILRTDFDRQDLFNYHPSQKILILQGVQNRLNGVYVPMGKSVEQNAFKAGTETILSPDWKKSDIYYKNFQISTKIEKVLLFTNYIALN